MQFSSSSLSSKSPSFTAQQQESSEDLADIAARVVNELKLNSPFDDEDEDVVYISDDDDDDSDEDSEFEFAILTNEETSSPISADEIFSNGQIKPMYYYPVFGTDLRKAYDNDNNTSDEKSPTLRLPLRKLLSEERKNNNNNVHGGEELEGVPAGTYCVWAPKKKGEGERTRDGHVIMEKKSRSTGSTSSKRWRFRDLLPRSNSDGKDTFVFLTPVATTTTTTTATTSEGKRKERVINVGKRKGGERKSYLPYRQDLVGLFASVNGISRTVRPF